MPKSKAKRASGINEKPAAAGHRPRASREETTARILDAAAELFSQKNPRDVTVREIAESAGVTHALVHQYVGTKEDLLNAVIQQVAVNRTGLVKRSKDLGDALHVLSKQVLENRVHSKALVRSAMDGVEYVSLKDRIATGEALVALAERTAASGARQGEAPKDIQINVLIASINSLLFGWVATEDWIWDVFDLDPEQKDDIYRQVEEIVGYLADLMLQPGESRNGT